MNKTPASIITDSIIAVLSEDPRVLFAFLYGSVAESRQGNDIDIAVYGAPEADFHKLSADLKIALHQRIGLSSDAFDVRVINEVVERGDIFDLQCAQQQSTSDRQGSRRPRRVSGALRNEVSGV
jgi:predicted nucleotidyltransferase